jgi:Ni,Fe-hydrogenase III large subunit/NADH:ubiquinone oxidoreductase subunit C
MAGDAAFGSGAVVRTRDTGIFGRLVQSGDEIDFREFAVMMSQRDDLYALQELLNALPHMNGGIHALPVDASHWGEAAQLARGNGARWAGVWADERGEVFRLYACLQYGGAYVLLQTEVPAAEPVLPSQAPHYLAADRPERHIQDLFGIRFSDHPEQLKRWTRHQAWDADSFPLRAAFPAQGFRTDAAPPDMEYPFLKAHGDSVYEIPVGPIHAGIIEPGHFRFQAVGETVLHLEERLGYVHKGIEKIAVGREPEGLARLAGRVSGDTAVGHAWAACMAMERAAGINIPPRAQYVRAVLAERERIINHLWDMAALCNDVAFSFGFYQFGRLRELWLRENLAFFGHRLMMDCIVPGGVRCDLSSEALAQTRQSLAALGRELSELIIIIDNNSSLEDRFLRCGKLSLAQAEALGALGFVGRSSGQSFDVRKDIPYAPYDQLQVDVPLERDGDVAARFWIRYKELRATIRLCRQLLEQLPGGALLAPWTPPRAGAESMAAVEGWRGEILCFVRFADNNRIARYYPRDPSIVNWPALEKIVLENIVPDFPVCNKSVNGSYSGQDL